MSRPPTEPFAAVAAPRHADPAPTAASPDAPHWKLARDPYLAPVVRRWGENAAFEAGFFTDADPTDAPLDDVTWLGTPTARVRAGLAAARARGDLAGGPALVVLLSTGGFLPIHAGHLAMMDAARRALTAEGRTVVGGYLSPGHDAYLRLKRGPGGPPAPARLAMASAALDESDWLEIDPWEALGRRVAVNYTDVTARLQAYLRAHVDPAIDVWSVCGADNARFSLAFTERGGCVVVGRPGYEAERDRWRHDPRVTGAPNVRWVDGDRADASSTLPVPAIRPAARLLRLRLEDARAVRTLALDPARWRRFQQWLSTELAAMIDVTAVAVPLDERPAAGTISLDPYQPGEIDLGVSRRFDLGGHRFLDHVSRPGHAPLATQLARIPPGPWHLVDDDRATGGTLDVVRRRLPPGVTVTAHVPHAATAAVEIADSRDFLLGTDDGGLVVALPDGSTGRAPYLLPYVDPAARAGLPAAAAVAFSAAVWDANTGVFAGTARRVGDLPPPARRTIRLAGHPDDALLTDVCAAHATALRALLTI